MDARVGPGGEVLLAPLPPPAPVHLVELHLHLAVARGPAVGVEERHVEPVLRVGEQHPARAVALRRAEADVALVGGVGDAEAVDAEGPPGLEDAGREVGAQLARGDRLRRDRRVHPGLARSRRGCPRRSSAARSSYLRVGSSKTYSSKRSNVVRAGERASSTSAFRLRAGAPWSQAEVRTPPTRLPARSWSVPNSIAILSRLGMTVSTLSVLSKVAPPTLTRPV